MSQSPVLPLRGIRVLDLTRLLPGGYASQMLADLGADVVKIEEPGAGDYSRTMPPLAGEVGHGFLAVNRGKRSAALNLKHPAGREALLRLIDGADVLLEGFRPGTLERLGLGYPVLRARNRRLVIASITGYGQDGPYRLRAGHDLNYIGYAGLLAHLTRPGQPPTLPGAQFADIAGGALMAVVGVLAALVGRVGSGEGCVVDVSMLDGALALMPLLASMVLNGVPEPAPSEGWLAGALPGYGVYQTADEQYLTLGALEPKFWAALCQRIGRPDLVGRQFPRDRAERDALEHELADVFRGRTRAEWVATLGDEDVCVGPVNRLSEALEDPQVRARGLVYGVDFGPRAGAGQALRLVPRLVDGRGEAESQPDAMSDALADNRAGRRDGVLPELGEHTAELLRQAGYADEAIGRLAADGAIAVWQRDGEPVDADI